MLLLSANFQSSESGRVSFSLQLTSYTIKHSQIFFLNCRTDQKGIQQNQDLELERVLMICGNSTILHEFCETAII